MPVMEKDLVHGCGRTFKYPAHYAKHGLKCDGTKPATSGRIAARHEGTQEEETRRTPPAAKKARRSTKRSRTSVRRRGSPNTIRLRVPRSVVVSVRDKFLAELRADKAKLATVIEKIDDTIRAVEALA